MDMNTLRLDRDSKQLDAFGSYDISKRNNVSLTANNNTFSAQYVFTKKKITKNKFSAFKIMFL